MRRALLLLVLSALLPSAARAGDPPPEPPAAVDMAAQVEAWLKDLTSASYDVREAARSGLEKKGREAPDVLRAHVDDVDPEVRRTVRALLDRLGGVSTRAPAAAADLATIGCVTLDVKARALGDVLAEVEAALGGGFAFEPGAAARPVTVHLADAPYFTAIETLAAEARLRGPTPFDAEAQLALVEADPQQALAPSASAGPVRVRATKVSASRALDGVGRRTHTLTLEVQFAPCVQLVSYRWPRVIRAVDPAGRVWQPAAGVQPAPLYGVGPATRSVELTVALEPPPEGEERLATLDLVLPLRLRHERHAVRFAPLDGLPRTLDENGKPAEAGAKGTVTLASVAPAEGRGDTWIADLSTVFTTGGARESAEIWCTAASGARRRLWISGGRSTSGTDGRMKLVGRAFGVPDKSLADVVVVWFDRESEGDLAVTLRDVPLR